MRRELGKVVQAVAPPAGGGSARPNRLSRSVTRLRSSGGPSTVVDDVDARRQLALHRFEHRVATSPPGGAPPRRGVTDPGRSMEAATCVVRRVDIGSYTPDRHSSRARRTPPAATADTASRARTRLVTGPATIRRGIRTTACRPSRERSPPDVARSGFGPTASVRRQSGCSQDPNRPSRRIREPSAHAGQVGHAVPARDGRRSRWPVAMRFRTAAIPSGVRPP